MAYDFGSQALGISNPFKTEGKIRLVAGIVIAAMAVMPLLQVAETLKQDPARAWGFVAIGLFLLTWVCAVSQPPRCSCFVFMLAARCLRHWRITTVLLSGKMPRQKNKVAAWLMTLKNSNPC